ncbi:MAG: hypothetical protein D6702_07265, partial [Planctomycetota bacterium]
MSRLRLAALLAALLTAAAALVWPPLYTDGDSCLYAALGHEVAGGGAWAAPTWAHDGGRACFHENPPLVAWLPAALERTGLDDRRAPALANALWLLLLAAAAWRLAHGADGAGPLAWTAVLLTLPVLKAAGRCGLDLPFAACVTAAVACLRSRAATLRLAGGLAFAGAALARGPFALLVPALWFLDARIGRRRSLRPALAAGVLGLSLAVAFDLAHRTAAGHRFWSAFWSEQLAPSLAGTAPHPNHGSTWAYAAGRFALYGQPWLLLGLVGGLRRWKRIRPEVLLGLLWCGLVVAGTALARREASRYLFAAWPGVAILFA